MEENKRKEIEIEDLELSPKEELQKEVSVLFRDDQMKIATEMVVMTKKRMNLVSKLFANIDAITRLLFQEERLSALSNKELINLLSVQLKAVSSMSISPDEHENVIDTLNIQVNNLLTKDEGILRDVPKESRERMREVLSGIIKQLSNKGDINESN